MSDSPKLSTAFYSSIKTVALPSLSPQGEFSVTEQAYLDSRILRSLLAGSMEGTLYQRANGTVLAFTTTCVYFLAHF